jgi:hypothetical protein
MMRRPTRIWPAKRLPGPHQQGICGWCEAPLLLDWRNGAPPPEWNRQRRHAIPALVHGTVPLAGVFWIGAIPDILAQHHGEPGAQAASVRAKRAAPRRRRQDRRLDRPLGHA